MIQSNTISPERFPLGQILATPGALEALSRNHQAASEFILRHVSGDWGDLPPDDIAANNTAVDSGDRILSAYTLKDRNTSPVCNIPNR